MNFELFNKIIATEEIFQVMRETKEDSCYHREESVFVHTMMVCDEFNRLYAELEDDYFVGLFACLFHDIGKPACKVQKHNEVRGAYWAFSGHDEVSANMAEDIMVRYGFNEFDIARICWMIRQHQVFWSVKDNDKKVRIANAFINPGIWVNYECFRTFMIADDMGRIADIREVDSVAYFKEFEQQYLHRG